MPGQNIPGLGTGAPGTGWRRSEQELGVKNSSLSGVFSFDTFTALDLLFLVGFSNLK